MAPVFAPVRSIFIDERFRENHESPSFHARRPTGKTQITATKACDTATDLALAYTPGLATPCRAIQRHPDSVHRYTNKGNLVAIVSNGTAVLGLGNLGPLAAKPVMKGKSLLFKRLADIDAFDLELDVVHPEELVRLVTAIAPTFGGINLEDIKAPECFEIEEALIDALPIPVFHDDQHGTAIVVRAALLNGLDFQGIVDSRAVVYSERTDLNRYKRRFATQSAVRTQVRLRGSSWALDSMEGALLTARADVHNLSEGVQEIGLRVPGTAAARCHGGGDLSGANHVSPSTSQGRWNEQKPGP